MLIRFRVSNHRSLRDEQILHLTAGARSAVPLVDKRILGIKLVRVAGIYGANASGKSNLIEALSFVSHAVSQSYRVWKPGGGVPREPFLLDASSKNRDSEYELDFFVGDVPYTYGFTLDSRQITGEWLYAYPSSRKQTWFTRDRDDQFTFGGNLKGPNRTIESLTRENSLFLSVAAQNNHDQLQPLYEWITRGLMFASPNAPELARAAAVRGVLADPEARRKVLSLVASSDLGITDMVVREEPIERLGEALKAMAKAIRSNGEESVEWDIPASTTRISFVHRSTDSPGGVSLPLEAESTGTRVLFHLSWPLLSALSSGGVLCVDELDSSLHSQLAKQIVEMFQNPAHNPHGAQLVFNTHDTNLLSFDMGDGPLLYRDQIWFTEKKPDGATELYPLTDFHPRKHENLERGYLQGRYGAIPFIGPWPFDSTARRRDGAQTDEQLRLDLAGPNE